jgi:hypothetical protein
MATLGKEYDRLYMYVYWTKKYTKEEIKESEDKASEAEKLFLSELAKYIEKKEVECKDIVNDNVDVLIRLAKK